VCVQALHRDLLAGQHVLGSKDAAHASGAQLGEHTILLGQDISDVNHRFPRTWR
jgi:hypothetical protein